MTVHSRTSAGQRPARDNRQAREEQIARWSEAYAAAASSRRPDRANQPTR